MSKRSRKTRNEKQPEKLTAGGVEGESEARPADHSYAEPKMVVSGAAFQQFDAWLDGQLDELVGRWIHAAAPAASRSVRRIVREAARPEQA
jgi:hypothetical protein